MAPKFTRRSLARAGLGALTLAPAAKLGRVQNRTPEQETPDDGGGLLPRDVQVRTPDAPEAEPPFVMEAPWLPRCGPFPDGEDRYDVYRVRNTELDRRAGRHRVELFPGIEGDTPPGRGGPGRPRRRGGPGRGDAARSARRRRLPHLPHRGRLVGGRLPPLHPGARRLVGGAPAPARPRGGHGAVLRERVAAAGRRLTGYLAKLSKCGGAVHFGRPARASRRIEK